MAPCGCHLGGATVAPDILGAMWHLRGCRFLDNEMAPFLVPLGTTCRNGVGLLGTQVISKYVFVTRIR